MYRIFLALFLFTCSVGFGLDKKKPKKTTDNASYVEAMVTVGNNGCGFLLQLSNGHLIKPLNLPKKYQHYNTKVLVKFENLKLITESPCNVEKEGNILEIKTYKINRKAKGKF